jgi:hypothetical protein
MGQSCVALKGESPKLEYSILAERSPLSANHQKSSDIPWRCDKSRDRGWAAVEKSTI